MSKNNLSTGAASIASVLIFFKEHRLCLSWVIIIFHVINSLFQVDF